MTINFVFYVLSFKLSSQTLLFLQFLEQNGGKCKQIWKNCSDFFSLSSRNIMTSNFVVLFFLPNRTKKIFNFWYFRNTIKQKKSVKIWNHSFDLHN